jgi:SAM-dependent methyltransferase
MSTSQAPTAAATEPGWLAEVLACPRCHGALRRDDGDWACEACGVVGHTRLGFADFVPWDRDLPMANHDALELEPDEALADELHARYDELDYAGLRDIALERNAKRSEVASASPRRQRTLARFHARLARTNAQAGDRHGPALLTKVDAKLAELGWPPMPGGVALEAGGGHGYYALGFAGRFERVIFVDASLPNLVLASKLAAEQGRDNVAFLRADVTMLPLRTGTCDLVHQNGVIEHVHDPDQMVRESARVRSDDGYYVCVSPNRLSLLPEPHFGVPGFGFVPEPLRRRLIPLLRGFGSEAGTDLRTLPALRGHFARAQEHSAEIFFLPRRLPTTARQTTVRRAIQRALELPGLGGALSWVLNVALLPVVPQHIVVARKGATPGR